MNDFIECFRPGVGTFSNRNRLNAFGVEGGKVHIVIAGPFVGILARRRYHNDASLGAPASSTIS